MIDNFVALLFTKKSFAACISFNIILLAFVANVYILAPEAVTDLDSEQNYGSGSQTKITINWMVSSESKS